jgi:hypothetical protein
VTAYSKAEIEKFLLAIDRQLKRPFDLIIIGGTAAALAYEVTTFTKDIDTVNQVTAIQSAYEAAKRETGLDIPMGPVGVYDAPYDFEIRLQEYPLQGARFLRVRIPERHDLALMKMVRGQQNDLDTVTEMHLNEALSFDTLIKLISVEMRQVVGNKRSIKRNFLSMFESLFGEAPLKDAENRLKGWERT